jgi:hypothetical protein
MNKEQFSTQKTGWQMASRMGFLIACVLVFVLVAAACSAPTPEPTPTPDLGLAYVNSVAKKMTSCSDGLKKVNVHRGKLDADPALIDDENWQSEMKGLLDGFENTCGMIGDNENVPDKYQAANEALKNASSEFKLVAETARKAYPEKSNDLLSEVQTHLDKGVSFLDQVSLP